jgi:hypothetical protein
MTTHNIDTLLSDIAEGKWKLPLEQQLDRIYDVCDELMRNERWVELDIWLRTYPTNKRHIDLMMALLTATLPVKSKLPGRITLYNEIERELKLRGEWEENLLQGLE